ncbi:carbohydrate-binding protein [Carboxylicivirga mesophila]|uniref:glucan endo-1,3-beta-D-glucosidase n=1 Tax=Carboxylicivirga mesophila TaxID=1166478 RepID=A0ABS5KFN7_9BACT|nr:glycosyl hydrolase [Carboxylicivirga mesophila]MBS2213879.1 carbohydrate-binding protein [Carboxylicivirga mesophila]
MEIKHLKKVHKGLSFLLLIVLTMLLLVIVEGKAQTVSVGSGSYTTSFPGVDAAGRNGYPSGLPQLSGNAVGKPVPTNDWWSRLIKENHTANMYNYPLGLQSRTDGLVVSYIPWGVYGDQEPIVVGVESLNAAQATVSDYSDWTVTMDWNDGSHNFNATAGIGMPFLYFTKGSSDVAEITVNAGTAAISDEMLLITNAASGADFVAYAPTGSTWTQNGNTYTSTLNGQNYWSMAMLPLTTTDVASTAAAYKAYAYVFPTGTTTSWSYNETTSVLRTDFTVTTEVKEGSASNMLLGLLPHQWANLAGDSPQPNGDSYPSVRGELKTLAGNTFSVENTYQGILPTLPYLANYSQGFSPAELTAKIKLIENDQLATWTDSYNEGQVMNRLIQTARIADQMGMTEARDKMVATVKERLEDWLSYQSGEVAFLFYYNNTWSAMLGYPAGHGQDTNINDHHFHWGYFIHAAAFMEQFEPGWAAQWGDMINLLVRDAASQNRNDDKFPFLRNFSPYAGHCWANGFASFPQGNDQESTSESMQFNSSLIHWGSITGNDEIRDLGIYLYTTEQTAIEEYWFDMYERNFKQDQPYSLVSRVWGNSYDNGTFWTSDIAASYGIEMYPIHGGSLYLGHNTAYVEKLWNEIKANTGIMNNEENPNLWHDVMWEYQSFIDPEGAIALYNSYPDRHLKFGVSDAQTYHWLHNMSAMGQVNSGVTADYPIAVVFDNDGDKTYVAHNYTSSPLTVTFSDGYELYVPANAMATSKDIDASGVLSADFTRAYANGSVNLLLEATGNGITKVEFYDGNSLIVSKTLAPYTCKAENLTLGMHGLYAKVYVDENFVVSNTIDVQVGEQVPYLGAASELPGIIEPGNYDKFEGGKANNIAYLDLSPGNAGDYRMDEDVDAASDNDEGKTIGWIAGGEWTEYTVNVSQSGLYSMSFRYASGNAAGGGPFSVLVDGQSVASNISVPSTSTTSWDVWATKSVADLPLTEGEHTLRLEFAAGEFNLGQMTFSRTGDIPYSYPIASAGVDIKVLWPLSTATLDATASSESSGQTLSYQWTQLYGPSVVTYDDNTLAQPVISGLLEGVYRFRLEVSNEDMRTSNDEVLVIVSSTANIPPNVTLTAPEEGATYKEGDEITIAASASDLDGSIQRVDFYQNGMLIESDDTAPYTIQWTGTAGDYALTAKAIDDGGAMAESQTVNVSFAEVRSCTINSTEAQQGIFDIGYQFVFETVGSDVYISCELLDDEVGTIAYLWTQDPFSETSMNHVDGRKFSTVLGSQTQGVTITVAVKFAFSGGLAVTEYVSYMVGDNCEPDFEEPTNFTAAVGTVTQSSVELLLQASDNSGGVIYQISYNGQTKLATAESGVELSYEVTGLSASTAYNFSIVAADNAGNVAANSPVVLNATTSESANDACAGTEVEASQGAFEVGYNYAFSTSGTDVTVSFELLDDKDGQVAYLWNYTNGFAESAMSNNNGVFTTTLSNQTPGAVLQLACKFAFAGGMSVTKIFSYTVGDNCVATGIETNPGVLRAPYPNPVNTWLNLELPEDHSVIKVFDMKGNALDVISVTGKTCQYQMGAYPAGIYFFIINGQSYKIIKK